MDGAERGKPLILYVDDDDLVAYLVQRETANFDIIRVSDGDRAMEFLNRLGEYRDAPSPAFVLLDLHMPKRDGFEILAEIRASPLLTEVPVAIFTTSQWPDDREKAFRLGANYFIQKPIDIEGFAKLAGDLAEIAGKAEVASRRRA